MQTAANTPIIPGDVSVDILESVKMALAKAPRIRRLPQAAPKYVEQIKRGLDSTLPGIEKVKKALRPVMTHPVYFRRHARELPRVKRQRVKRELLDAGMTMYGLIKAESRYLPRILHDNEHLEAVIYGQHGSSSAMLVATDERIIYLDKKPMVEMFDEVSYEVVSGIEFDVHTFFATVVLHTPVRNYDFRLVNLRCGEKFARLIEKQRLEREEQEFERLPQPEAESATEEVVRHSHELEEDMAGYYWLPTDEEERSKVQEYYS